MLLIAERLLELNSKAGCFGEDEGYERLICPDPVVRVQTPE